MFDNVLARSRKHRRADVLLMFWLAGLLALMIAGFWGSAWGAATFVASAKAVAKNPAIQVTLTDGGVASVEYTAVEKK